MDEREKITPGTNDRSVDETIAGTGPGIPDDSLAPSEDELPEPPSDDDVERIREKLGTSKAEEDTLPLEGE
jgi:hypothetical protein